MRLMLSETWPGAVMATAIALASGCGAKAPNPTVSIRDSSGVQIVENTGPLGTESPWILDSIPSIDLGNPTAPGQEFDQFVGAFRLHDGRLVVGDGASQELRYFGADGVFLKTAGRKGGGPGEFEHLGWLDLGEGDSLRAFDFSTGRLSTFSPEGAWVRQVILTPSGENESPRPLGGIGAELVVMAQKFVTPQSKPGVVRDSVPLQLYGANGTATRLLGRFLGDEALIETGDQSVSVAGLPLGKQTHFAVGADQVIVGTADRPEFMVVGLTGGVRRMVRWAEPLVPVTPGDVDGYLARFAREAWKPGQEAMRDRFLTMLKAAPWPKTKPAYAGIIVGPGGSVWVRAYTEPDRYAPTRFSVFDSTGRSVGRVVMPVGFSPTQIGQDFVVGAWKDPDDVVHVRVYRMKAGSAAKP